MTELAETLSTRQLRHRGRARPRRRPGAWVRERQAAATSTGTATCRRPWSFPVRVSAFACSGNAEDLPDAATGGASRGHPACSSTRAVSVSRPGRSRRPTSRVGARTNRSTGELDRVRDRERRQKSHGKDTRRQGLGRTRRVPCGRGEPDLLYIDLHVLHEVNTPQAFDVLRAAGRTVRRPELTFATEDHAVPTHRPAAPRRGAGLAGRCAATQLPGVRHRIVFSRRDDRTASCTSSRPSSDWRSQV